MDRASNRIFYVDHNTRTTSWERPPPPSPVSPPSPLRLPMTPTATPASTPLALSNDNLRMLGMYVGA